MSKTSTEERREYQRNWYAKNIEKRREASRINMRNWRKNNPEAARAVHKKWRDKNPETIRNIFLKRTYGITFEQWQLLFDKQDRKCAVCKSSTTGGRGWHLDHCHSTMKIRGILCNHCNLMLGHARDNTDVLNSAILYLTAT